MITDDSIDRTLRAIDMIIHGEVAEPTLKLKRGQRLEQEQVSTGARLRLVAAGLGIVAICLAVVLSYTAFPPATRRALVQDIPSPQRRPLSAMEPPTSAPKAYGASVVKEEQRAASVLSARARPRSRMPTKPVQPVKAAAPTAEALRAALIDDARQTREQNHEELTNMQRR